MLALTHQRIMWIRASSVSDSRFARCREMMMHRWLSLRAPAAVSDHHAFAPRQAVDRMSFDISKFGVFTPAMLRALARVLDATAPVGETRTDREARASKLLFLAHLGSGYTTSTVIDALPVLRKRAREFATTADEADKLLEEALQLATSIAEAAPDQHQIGQWLAVLLEMKAVCWGSHSISASISMQHPEQAS